MGTLKVATSSASIRFDACVSISSTASEPTYRSLKCVLAAGGAHTRTSRPVLLGVAHAPLPSADPSATVRTPGANATVSNVPPVLRHAPAPPPLAAVPRSIAASATSNEKQEEEHLPPGMPPPQNINRSCVPSQTMAEPTTSDEKDEDEELLPPGMAPLSAPPVHSRMLQFQVPEFGVPPVPMDASVARPPPPLAAVPAGTKAKGFYAPTPEYTTSQLPTEAKQQQKKQTTAQVAEHDARDEVCTALPAHVSLISCTHEH